jgi:transcriptional regulator with XRE-family HTH domain
MDKKIQVNLRSKKLGVLIRDARITNRRTLQECAQITGVTPGIFKAWEEGRKSPSLPELEMFSYSLNIPMDRFWAKTSITNSLPAHASMNAPAMISLRQRMIGALLHQARENAGLTLASLEELSGISSRRLKKFELGDHPVPLPELEGILELIGSRVEAFFSQTGTVGNWLAQQKTMEGFLQLPPEVQEFVCQPVNLPYLKLAKKLSSMSSEKLRSVAEDLLDITL